jgi:hypothetical protein
MPLPDIAAATRSYERWLGAQIPRVRADIAYKHEQMSLDPFRFLRATFYRWAQVWDEACGELHDAVVVLGVGDLHVDNFGSWRDAEGRLVWGINDFDEACMLPYTNDLVRLATSVHLAVKESKHLNLSPADACKQLLAGYRDALQRGGEPAVLEGRLQWLRSIAVDESRDAAHFWKRMERLSDWKERLPEAGLDALRALLPDDTAALRFKRRRAGEGSLGRQRVVAVGTWQGAPIAREAKALAVSAWRWTRGDSGGRILYGEVLSRAVRSRDPYVQPQNGWIVRRLAPDCSRIELASLTALKDDLRLLRSMGFETANVHLGTKGAAAGILNDLDRRRSDWLNDAARRMARLVRDDWKAWRKRDR